MLYLICFDRPLKHARHYLGFSRNDKTLPKRIEHHRKGSGARLMAAVVAAGIDFRVVRTWDDADRNEERRLKNRHKGPKLCPHCAARVAAAAAKGRKRRAKPKPVKPKAEPQPKRRAA